MSANPNAAIATPRKTMWFFISALLSMAYVVLHGPFVGSLL